MGALIPLIHNVKLFLRLTYISVVDGEGKETVPSLVGWGGECPVQFEPQCFLYGPVSQLSHHNSLGQGGLNSICHLEKHHCVIGEGCDRHHHPACPPLDVCWLHTSSTSPRTTGKLRRISEAKLDPRPEDEETLVTSLPIRVSQK